jgi:CheY-like chemotaxis protein
VKNIIVCEDIPNTMFEISQRLNSLGYNVLKAYRPQAAIDFAREREPFAALMDITFDNYANSKVPIDQQINGLDCGVFLYQIYNLPIVFFTVDDAVVDQNPAARRLRDRYGAIAKTPLDTKSLEQVVTHALDAHRAWNAVNAFFSIDSSLKIIAVNDAAKIAPGTIALGMQAQQVLDRQTLSALDQLAQRKDSSGVQFSTPRYLEAPIAQYLQPHRQCTCMVTLQASGLSGHARSIVHAKSTLYPSCRVFLCPSDTYLHQLSTPFIEAAKIFVHLE